MLRGPRVWGGSLREWREEHVLVLGWLLALPGLIWVLEKRVFSHRHGGLRQSGGPIPLQVQRGRFPDPVADRTCPSQEPAVGRAHAVAPSTPLLDWGRHLGASFFQKS